MVKGEVQEGYGRSGLKKLWWVVCRNQLCCISLTLMWLREARQSEEWVRLGQGKGWDEVRDRQGKGQDDVKDGTG